MSDELVKTVVLDQLPFANGPGTPANKRPRPGAPLPGGSDEGEDGKSIEYPGFETTSWLT